LVMRCSLPRCSGLGVGCGRRSRYHVDLMVKAELFPWDVFRKWASYFFASHQQFNGKWYSPFCPQQVKSIPPIWQERSQTIWRIISLQIGYLWVSHSNRNINFWVFSLYLKKKFRYRCICQILMYSHPEKTTHINMWSKFTSNIF
jgi:hypothetical protein